MSKRPSQATNIGALNATDAIPVDRLGKEDAAYSTTPADIANFVAALINEFTGVGVGLNGSIIGTRPTFNLIKGAGINIAVSDNGASGRVDVTLSLDTSGIVGALPDPTGHTNQWLKNLNGVDVEYSDLPIVNATDSNGLLTYQDKAKLDGIAANAVALGETSGTAYRGDRGKTAYDHSQTAHAPSDAEQNVNADWNAASGDAQILNKPTLGTASAAAITDFAAALGTDDNYVTDAEKSALHAAVTVEDTVSINMTLTGQQVKADAIFGTTAGTICQGTDVRLQDPTRVARPEWFGLVSGVLNTAAVQAAVDSLPPYGKLIMDTYHFKFDIVTISTPHIEVTGTGIIDGTFLVTASPSNITAEYLDMFTNIHGLTFHNLSERANAAGIILLNARRGDIASNKFFGFQDCIRVPVNTDPTALGGHVARWKISGNKYGFSADESINSPNPDYFLHCHDSYSHASMSVADMTVCNNEGTANISHIDIDSIDGLTQHDNTWFFPALLPTKKQSVKVTYGAWVTIHDDKMWEAGEEGILLDQCARYNLHDNMIAWPGQYTESAGIKVTGTPTAGEYYGQGKIHSNEIIEPTGHGIDIGAKEGRSQIYQNHVFYPGRDDRYYGVPALSGTQKLIKTDTDTINLIVKDNFGTYKDYDLTPGGTNHTNVNEGNVVDTQGDGGGVVSQTDDFVYTVTTEETLDVTRVDQLNFLHTAPTDFTGFTTLLPANKIKNFSVRFYNTNTTLIASPTLILKDNANVNPPLNGFMEFQAISDGVSCYTAEVSRSFGGGIATGLTDQDGDGWTFTMVEVSDGQFQPVWVRI